MARRVDTSGTVKVSSAQTKDAASNASITALAAATGKIPHVHGMIISTDTAGTYALKIGSTTMAEFYLAANSGFADMLAPYFLSNDTANEAVTLTKPSGATTSITLFYTLEPSL